MSKYNVSTSHPLIPSSQEYFFNKKCVSIHSDDRDMQKYPNSAEFEIELPQDYVNVEGVKLSTWSFPSNYNVFSNMQRNTKLSFKMTDLYNNGAGPNPVFNLTRSETFAALYANIANEYIIEIEDGFYSPTQMAKELTNKMNEIITNEVKQYLVSTGDPYNILPTYEGYSEFVVAYNCVSQNLWFGNSCDGFTLVNNSIIYSASKQINFSCKGNSTYPEDANWGLPVYLGFTYDSVTSIATPQNNPPRFYYGDALVSGDDGYWLQGDPTFTDSKLHYLSAPLKINLLGDAYFYMELEGLNNMDETIPFASNCFTKHTNVTNGVVNSAFAKIGVVSTPSSQWYGQSQEAFKWFNPPAERIRKLRVKMRYHNGSLVNFGLFNYSFTLDFVLLTPQINRKYHAHVPEVNYPY
jgi:hypothetical protein